jgi:hypothetical protein
MKLARGPTESRDIFMDLLPPAMRAHLKTPVPDQLSHYTSMGAMHAILDRAEIYATDARFLNDREELIHASTFADELILSQQHPLEVIDFVRQHVKRTFDVFLSLRNPYRNYDTCFTTRGDELSQWRAYSGGSAGASLALDLRGFSPSGNLAPCVYLHREKRRLLEDLFNEIFNVAETHFRMDPALLIPPDANLPAETKARFPWAEENVKLTSARLLVPIMKIIPLFKHSSFKDENEWRSCSLVLSLIPL